MLQNLPPTLILIGILIDNQVETILSSYDLQARIDHLSLFY